MFAQLSLSALPAFATGEYTTKTDKNSNAKTQIIRIPMDKNSGAKNLDDKNSGNKNLDR